MRIAKKALRPENLKRLMQHFARGGEVCHGGTVKKMADGGEVTDTEKKPEEKPKEEKAPGWNVADKISAMLPDFLSGRKAVQQHNDRLAQMDKETSGYAKGGEVGGMDLSRVKLVKETPTAWHLDDGRPFKVAKAAVGKRLAQQIAQHFAEGGEADASGTDAALGVTPPNPDISEPFAAPSTPSDAEMVAGYTGDATQPAEARGAGPGAGTVPVTTDPFPLPGQPAVIANGDGSGTAAALGATPPPAQPTALPSVATPPDTSGKTQKEITAAYNAATVAEQAKADAAKREAAEALIVQQKNEEQRAGLTAQWQKTWQDWQTRGDDLRRGIMEARVDPNRYWNEKSTSGKVSAAIGLILGGIGSGLTKTPNAALQVIENAINRDVDAQKADLGKKESLLGFHMQEGHALQASFQLARADLMDAAAAKLSMVATKYAGDKAQANAQGAIAALQEKAALTRQQVAAAGLQMQLHGMQLEQAKMQLGMGRMQMAALSALTSGQAQAGQTGQGVGTRLDPRVIPYLPDHIQKTLVRLPDGSFATARDPKDTEASNKAFEHADIIRQKLARYRAILDSHPHGVSSTLNPKDYATAQSLRDSLITDLNGLAGLNRLNEREVELFSNRIPDITSKQLRTSGHQAKLDELGQEIDDAVWANQKAYLNLPARRRPGA
jgi:hypothetical protein